MDWIWVNCKLNGGEFLISLLLMRNMVSCCMSLFWGEAGYVCNSNGMAWLWLFCCCVQCSLISCHAHTNVVNCVNLCFVLLSCDFIVLYVCMLAKQKIQ